MVQKMSVVEDLSKKSLEELEQALLRQKRLHNNKKLISGLPDKGAKIEESIKKLQEELEHRQKVEEIALVFSKLSSTDKNQALDSDDDEYPEEITKTNDSETSQDAFSKQRSEKLQDGTAIALNPFRLNRIMNSNPPSSKINWTKPPSDLDPDLSALSPVFSDTPAQLLTLTESMTIQKIQEDKLKEVEKRRSQVRIYERFGSSVQNCPPDAVEQLVYAGKNADSDEEESDITSSEEDEDTENLVREIEDALNEIL